MNKVAYQGLREADMLKAQVQVVAAHLPDWSQFATKRDLHQLESRMENQMTRMENRLIRWMVGSFLTFFALLGGSVTVVLNLAAVLNALRGL